jgi:copper chaperone NosL
MSAVTRALVIGAGVLAAFVGAVVWWPGKPDQGPAAIVWGRDTCARCRMILSEPGYAGQMRDREGTLHIFDDVGCLVAAIVQTHAEVPEAWVEDHAGGGFTPLLAAHLVRAPQAPTPMGHGLVAFKDAPAAQGFAAANAGTVVTFEDVLRNPAWLAPAGGGSS